MTTLGQPKVVLRVVIGCHMVVTWLSHGFHMVVTGSAYIIIFLMGEVGPSGTCPEWICLERICPELSVGDLSVICPRGLDERKR